MSAVRRFFQPGLCPRAVADQAVIGLYLGLAPVGRSAEKIVLASARKILAGVDTGRMADKEDATPLGYARAGRFLPGLVASTIGYHSEDQPPAIHRGLPSPYLTFIFALDAPVVSGESLEQAQSPAAYRNDIILGGLHTRPAYIVQPSGQLGIQLAVHPLAARTLFGPPTRELRSLTTEGADVLGPGADRLRERLVNEGSWDTRFSMLSDYLRARVEAAERRESPRPELREAWAWMARHHGAGSMEGMARHVALSRRQLNTLFTAELGVSPKTVSRLMRFNRTVQRIAGTITAGREVSLTEVAHRCDYYDQSHLVRDFQQFTGTSPSTWLAEERRNIQAGGHRNGEE